MRSGWREYLEQVRDIAPRDVLLGRSEELAAMEAFCLGPEPYWWWRAGPWAGKSALMSCFVLNPPSGTAVVSFFITARYASQDDSAAFTVTVSRQLEELLGQDLPHDGAPGEPESSYRLLLRQAAQHFERQGQRLVLAVDGLDEDRGPGRELPSIASLLPKHCDHGLRVIVASRPDPQIPSDVAPDHPLRDHSATHTLTRSSHAQVIRDAAEHELHSLLAGPRGQRNLLGLLTAARGGLTSTDLAALTRQLPYQIRDTVRSVTGRTFSSRPAYWATSDDEKAGPAYLLAHETLQTEAAAAFGPKQLTAYRDQICAWADTYQARNWPPDTPVYLLRGYFRMLQAAGDTPRILACATSPARHDRLLARSGGDTAALTEIATATGLLLTQPALDLATMTRLAYHRDTLTTRNQNIPTELPAVWVQLGNPARAEALAHSITDPSRQAQALADVARALAAAGLHDQAEQAAIQAEALARSITNPSGQAQALPDVARALADVGLHDRAEAFARSITNPYLQAQALGGVAQALAAAGLHDRAEALARSITNPYLQALALGGVARALAAAGLHDRAEALARSITNPYLQALALGPQFAHGMRWDRRSVSAGWVDVEQVEQALLEWVGLGYFGDSVAGASSQP